MKGIKIRKKWNWSDTELDLNSTRRVVKGNVLHLALSMVESLDDAGVEKAVEKALFLLGERRERWDVEKDFVNPIKRLLNKDEVKPFFSSEAEKVFVEREIISPKDPTGSRPDRMVIINDTVLVADFKSFYSEKRLNEYKAQVEEYTKLAGECFKRKAIGFLIFIDKARVLKVAET